MSLDAQIRSRGALALALASIGPRELIQVLEEAEGLGAGWDRRAILRFLGLCANTHARMAGSGALCLKAHSRCQDFGLHVGRTAGQIETRGATGPAWHWRDEVGEPFLPEGVNS